MIFPISARLALLALGLLASAGPLQAAPLTAAGPQAVIVRGGGGEVGFNRGTGRIVLLRRNGARGSQDVAVTPLGGELWTLGMRGGQQIRASDFLRGGRLDIRSAGPQSAQLVFTSGQGAVVTIHVAGSQRGIDFRLGVKGFADDVLDAAVPADLAFDPSRIRRVLFPEHLGIALQPSFFRAHPYAASWDSAPVGPTGLERVAGAQCRMDPLDAAPVAVRATPLGRRLLGLDVAGEWEAAPRSVNRAPLQAPEAELLTSDAGAFLSGHRVGSGMLLRFGGPVRAEDGSLAIRSAEHLLPALAKAAPDLGMKPHGTRVVLVCLTHGPTRGGMDSIVVADWETRLKASPLFAQAGLQLTVAGSAEALRAALRDGQTLAVINPYGEGFPGGDDWGATLDAIHLFLQQGGLWLETGGYSFYSAMTPNRFVSLEDHYPSRAFSDFGRIETPAAAVSLYGVQNAHDAPHIFVPAAWRVFGDAAGGHLQQRWQTFLPKGNGGETPPVRLRLGDPDAGTSLRTYARDNGLDRPLAAKMSAPTLRLWKRSLVIKLISRNVSEETSLLEHLPAPAVLHLVSYLRYGFDRGYPDHLPPNPTYGTAAQFHQLLALAHRKGDLVMPYTNTTWWCDNPKGPTFLQSGQTPLLVRLDGQTNHEVYGPGSSGWSISPFQPAVAASVDRLVTEFTRDYPVDVLFQDQNGARGLMYDLNVASPVPYAGTQGFIDLAARAGMAVPVATEDGFDHLLNAESEFCGLTQELVRFPYAQDTLLSDRLPDEDWEFFPMAQYVAHDKAFFMHHDLGPGVTDQDALLWSLALGYALSLPASPGGITDPKQAAWLDYLAMLQRRLGPHYMGAPLTAFRYAAGSGSRGVMDATYGDVEIVVNLTDRPFRHSGVVVEPHRFWFHALGLPANGMAGRDLL